MTDSDSCEKQKNRESETCLVDSFQLRQQSSYNIVVPLLLLPLWGVTTNNNSKQP
jgi:hypothetical protein